MAHDKMFGICENKCLVEVAPKTETDALKVSVDTKVSKDGNLAETITGLKTFTESPTISAEGNRGITVIRTDKALGDAWARYRWDTVKDKNGFTIGEYRITSSPDSTNNIVQAQHKKDDGTIVTSELTAVAEQDGTTYAVAPTPSSASDDSTKIATTAWVNKLDNDVVHKSRSEIISGAKTFTSSPFLSGGQLGYMVKRTDKALGDAWARYRWDVVYDKNGKTVMELLTTNDSGGTYTRLVSHTLIDGNDVLGELGVKVQSNGTIYASAPATPDTATSTEIATAGWVRDRRKVVSHTDITTLYDACANMAVGDELIFQTIKVVPDSDGADSGNIKLMSGLFKKSDATHLIGTCQITVGSTTEIHGMCYSIALTGSFQTHYTTAVNEIWKNSFYKVFDPSRISEITDVTIINYT